MRISRLAALLPLLLTGCQLPALPSLPKLPKLPSAADLAAALPVGSSGQSLKDAAAMAFATSDGWAAGSTWVSLTGNKLDPGGRNGGYKEGTWIFTFQTDAKPQALEVRVSQGAATQREISKKVFETPALSRDLGATIDSPDAVAKSGLSVKSLTIVLRQDASGPVYNMVEEGGVNRAVIDGKTGEKRPE
jgi:hypothetical protein